MGLLYTFNFLLGALYFFLGILSFLNNHYRGNMLGSIGSGEMVIILMILVIPGLFGLIALIDILRNIFTGSYKIVWALVVLLLPFFGPILYLFIGSRQRVQGSPGNLKT